MKKNSFGSASWVDGKGYADKGGGPFGLAAAHETRVVGYQKMSASPRSSPIAVPTIPLRPPLSCSLHHSTSSAMMSSALLVGPANVTAQHCRPTKSILDTAVIVKDDCVPESVKRPVDTIQATQDAVDQIALSRNPVFPLTLSPSINSTRLLPVPAPPATSNRSSSFSRRSIESTVCQNVLPRVAAGRLPVLKPSSFNNLLECQHPCWTALSEIVK